VAKVLSRLDIILFANTAQYRREIRETGESTKTAMQAMADDAKKMAKVGAAAFASMAAAGATAVGVMVKEQIELGNEIARTAKIANSSVQAIQKQTIAVKASGIEMDKLGDIYKDTQDKVGDFLTTGGGEMADFFENIAPKVGVTAEEFRRLSGPDALQLYYDSLQKANLSQSELVFYMESVADEASLLIPYLHDGGAGFDIWYQAAKNAGAVMTDETIVATEQLRASTGLLTLSYEGAKNQFTQGIIPVLSDMAGMLIEDASAADTARKAGDLLAKGFKVLAATGVGVVAIVTSIGQALYGVAKAASQFGNGVDWSSPFAIFQVGSNFIENNKSAAAVLQQTASDIVKTYTDADAFMGKIMHLGENGTNKTVAAVVELNKAQDQLRKTLGQTGQEYQNQKKQAEDAAKAAEKAAKKTANSKSLIPKATADAILEGAKRLGVNPNDLAAVISFETSGKFSTNARNPGSSATGLIQFMEASDGKKDGKYYGHTRNQFGALLPLQQMEYVVKYLQGRGIGPGAGVAEIYDAVAGYGYKRGSKEYEQNKVWDVNGDGIVVKGEAVKGSRFRQHIKPYFSDGDAIAQNNIAEQAREAERIAEQQARQREAIRREYADKITQIEMDLAEKLKTIEESNFGDEEKKQLTAKAKERADIEIKQYQRAQDEKIAALTKFGKTEAELIKQDADQRIAALTLDQELTDTQKQAGIANIEAERDYKLSQLAYIHDVEMNQARSLEYTESERIKAQYALERRELELTLGMDEDLRAAKSHAINQAEQLALDELRYAHEDELRQLGSYGLTELQRIRADYEQQRREIERRTDIDSEQKSQLRNAVTGGEIYAVKDYQKNVRDQYGSLQSELNGTAANYQLAQEYESRLKLIQDALDAEVIAVKEAEKAKLDARMMFESAATQLSLTSSQTIASNLAESFKTVLGEQNAAYQAMFAAQQVFVMASAGLNMYDAWGDAMAEGATLSQKFAAAATIATEFGRIITAASSMKLELPGFKTGGFTSGGENEVVGFVHGEEFVANAGVTRTYRPELKAMHNGTYKRNSGNTNINVSVKVESNGQSTVESNQQLGKQLGAGLVEKIKQVLVQESKPGGLLYA